jgi:modulator of FtsH protease HflK
VVASALSGADSSDSIFLALGLQGAIALSKVELSQSSASIAIGDRDDLKYNSDGFLDLNVQREAVSGSCLIAKNLVRGDCGYQSELLRLKKMATELNLRPSLILWIVSVFFGGVLLIVGLSTSYYTVGAESEGVVRRFGQYFQTVGPGLHFKLPFGIDAVTVLPTRRQLKLEFGFVTPGYLTNPIQVGENPDEEKSMVTGDLNAALVEWVVQYRIDDPKQYLFDVRNPGETLRDLSEAAMREVVGDRTVDELITIGRQGIEIEALARMQELSKRYNLGIRVDQVQLKNVNPPSQVQASFNEVNKAQQDRENAINIANGEYNKVVPKAKGEADQTIRAAEGYRFKRVNEAEGDIAAFSAVLQEYIKAPEMTRIRLYLETMSEILPQTGQKIIVDESLRQLLPILPLSIRPGESRQ